MVAGHQERERRHKRLNSEAAERAHEAATRRRKVESGAVWFRAALLGKDLTWPVSTGLRKFRWANQRMGCGCGVSFRQLRTWRRLDLDRDGPIPAVRTAKEVRGSPSPATEQIHWVLRHDGGTLTRGQADYLD
jgi:hypothetical protein